MNMIKLTGQLTENTKWTTLNRTIIVKKGALQVDEMKSVSYRELWPLIQKIVKNLIISFLFLQENWLSIPPFKVKGSF